VARLTREHRPLIYSVAFPNCDRILTVWLPRSPFMARQRQLAYAHAFFE
jgi:hypothetical protein